MQWRRRRWGALAAVTVAAAASGLGAPAGQAQEGGSPAAAFGGFTANGRGNGVQFTYDVKDVFPLPSPLFQASVPEASTSYQSGPTATALGSVAYPGNILANLPAVVAQSSPDGAQYVPPYPVITRADYPAGPVEGRQDIGSANSVVRASEAAAEAVTTMGGGELPPFARVGAITTAARTGVVDGKIESRSRVEMSGVELFFGLLRIESIVTDLVATSDGTTAASAGETVLTGVSLLGVPVAIGPNGAEVREPSGPDAGPLSPAAGPLAGAVGPLNQALQEVFGTTNASVEELFAASGIRIRALEPIETVDGASASRVANGVVVEMTYDGRSDNPLAQLLAAIPSEDLPGEGLPGFPINTSPQALVNLMKETHITGIALAYGAVSVDATPAFEFSSTPLGGLGDVGVSPGGAFPSPSFGTPAPSLPPAPAGTTGVAGSPAGALGAASGAAAAVVLALMTAPVWAVGSRRLADGALGATSASCPEGKDVPGG